MEQKELLNIGSLLCEPTCFELGLQLMSAYNWEFSFYKIRYRFNNKKLFPEKNKGEHDHEILDIFEISYQIKEEIKSYNHKIKIQSSDVFSVRIKNNRLVIHQRWGVLDYYFSDFDFLCGHNIYSFKLIK